VRLTILAAALLLGCTPTGEPGSAAADYVSNEKYDSLVIEVDVVQGHSLDPRTKDFVLQELELIVDKSDGVRFEISDTIPVTATQQDYSLADLRELEESYRDYTNKKGTAALYLLLVNNAFDNLPDGSSVLGLAYSESAIVLFAEALEETCTFDSTQFDPSLRPLVCPVSAAMVVLHEIGHILGLVENGAPLSSAHRDKQHGNHCTSGKCIMYWQNNSPYVVGFVKQRFEIHNDEFPLFDVACQGDLDLIR
jgi:hypothetical protein